MLILYYVAVSFFLLLCFVLCCVVLMQESKATGLGASFGGDAGDSVFGTATADVLKKFTAWLIFIFLASCVILSLWTSALEQTRRPAPPSIEELGQ
ncbi:MAG: preprotein translocase subunit SecG [Verrucomicrobia bacterium]|nr:preprotein translocase subunit SecG [Verrucomicrobiota bacterium]